MKQGRPSEFNVKEPDCTHESCSFCGDDNVAIVVRGNDGASCNYCSNEIVMCQFCYSVVENRARKIIGS